MKICHIANSETAIPRGTKIGLLVFNHAFFMFDNEGIGIEITLFSWRWRSGGRYFSIFKYKNWKKSINCLRRQGGVNLER